MEKITALYCRFAYGDDQTEIENQKRLLAEFAAQNGCTNRKFYIDSGVSGLTMDRPAFCAMMEDIENGLVQTVITQDASRICRRASVSAQYIDEIFPSYGVSFLTPEEQDSKGLMDILLSCRDGRTPDA